MGFIKNIIEQHKEQVNIRKEKCAAYIADVDKTMQAADAILAGSSDFIDPTQADTWMQSNQEVLAIEYSSDFRQIRRAKDYKALVFKLNELKNRYSSLRQQIVSHNSQVARKKIGAAYEMIGDVEGRRLDDQQMLCLVKDVHNHLVIAGAGTGKTTTVVGKIKYLLKSGKYEPKDILVLSFTNASASEMCERIQKETGEKIVASTFHKLGLAIIKKVNGITPKISQLNLRAFVKEQLTANMQNDSYLALLSSYLLFNRVVAKSEFEFSSQAEYSEYLKLNPPTTMNGETVKSYGEMDIANFLMQNGISYIYEHPYSVDTRTSEYGQYNPDFYLPDYDIYIEYFGINKNGEVPSYFSGRNGMTATQAYRASMEWKRNTHKENGTTMIECFAYEKFDGTLLDNLKAKLERQSIELKPKSAKELWEQIASNESSILDGIIELFETLINLIKSNGYSIDDVRSLNTGSPNFQANNTILTLLEPIFNAYCQHLKEHNEIDFNDMIITATQYVRNGSFVNPFKYVIVDEYQDISKARFLLLQALRESSDYDLFCVGDDWQSIYRFAGSDIGYIINFEKYWGSTETSKIETTYRFSQQLIEISGGFIMKNPMQIKKAIKGKPSEHGFVLGHITG